MIFMKHLPTPMHKEEVDVLVVGAGPAGSCTAKYAAEHGLDVMVLEKRQEIGVPVRCGEGISCHAEEFYGKKFPNFVIAQTIDGAILYTPDGNKSKIEFDYTAGYILERKMFDRWLADEAARAGARIHSKTAVTGIIKEGTQITGVRAEFENEKFDVKAKCVVAADGVETRVARWAGLNTMNKLVNIDSGYQYEMVDIELEDPHKLIIYFGNKLSPRGYIWIFPKGEDRANVGIGVGGIGYEKTARGFLDEWIKTRPELKKGAVTGVVAGAIPVGGLLKNMVLDGLAVVGDAAHQVNPIHGGGMHESIEAAKILADVLAECNKKNDYSKEALSAYNTNWWKVRGEKLARIEKVKHVMEAMSDDDLNFIAKQLSGEDIVALTEGNAEKMKVMAKILMKRPKLLALATKLA